jgi:uncharacterized protein YigA (DUF484 family)
MSNNTPVLEDEVAQYLEKHPDFFSRHLELLNRLDIPHQSGNAVSLVEKQMQVLRQSNKELKNRFNKLLDVARQNESHFENTKQLVVELLDFQIRNGSLEDLLDIFELRFPTTLAANEFRLVLLDTELNQNLTKVLSISSKNLQDNAAKFYEMEKAYCGGMTKQERNFFFEEQAELIASCAVIPLQHKQLNGLLVVGNFKEDHFYKGMGTMFLDHIGDTIGRVLNELISKQASQSIAV